MFFFAYVFLMLFSHIDLYSKEERVSDFNYAKLSLIGVSSGISGFVASTGLGLVASIAVPILAIGYFGFYKPKQDAEKAKELAEKIRQADLQIKENDAKRLRAEELQARIYQENQQRMCVENKKTLDETLLLQHQPVQQNISNPPIFYGPFAKWNMPIFQDGQDRYWAKICCEITEHELHKNLERSATPTEIEQIKAGPNNISKTFAQSAWAVFDKAGEFLFEQNEDGKIDYPATATSFAIMALQMCYGGGLGPILSMASKDPNKSSIITKILISILEKIEGSSIPDLLGKCLLIKELVTTTINIIKHASKLVSDTGSFISGLETAYKYSGLQTAISFVKTQFSKFQTQKKSFNELLLPPKHCGDFTPFLIGEFHGFVNTENYMYWILNKEKDCWDVFAHPLHKKKLYSMTLDGKTIGSLNE